MPSPPSAVRRPYRPALEQLESRCLLSAGNLLFVQGLVQDLYGPQAPVGLVRRWEGRLDNGMGKLALLDRIATPALRHHARPGRDGVEGMVSRWYRRFLRREASAAEVRRFSLALRSGAEPEKALLLLLASREYRRRFLRRPSSPPMPSSSPRPTPIAVSSTSTLLNRPLTTDPGVQQMPSVAVNPRDGNHVAVAYMDYSQKDNGYAGIAVTVSRNAGDTWQTTTVPLPEDFDQAAGNPVAVFDAEGRLFITYMAATFFGGKPGLVNPVTTNHPTLGVRERTLGFQANNGVFVVRSDDGGATWGNPMAVAANRFDGINEVSFEIMPDIGVDKSLTLSDGLPNPNFGNLYAVWARFYPAGQFPGQPGSTGGSHAMIAVSRDGGWTWETQFQEQPDGSAVTVLRDSLDTGAAPPGLGAVIWPHVAVDPRGDVFVSMFEFGTYTMYRSTDGGESFIPPGPGTGRGLPFGTEGNDSPSSTNGLPGNRFRTQVQRAIAADPSQPGRVWAADAIQAQGALGNTIDPADVHLARSDDSGETWDNSFTLGGNGFASVANDDNDGRPAIDPFTDVVTGQALPRLATDAAGHVALAWYDTRRDPDSHLLDVFATFSTDGGETFRSNFRLTTSSFDANLGRFTDPNGLDNYFLGDGIGLALGNGNGYAAWTDTRNGNQDVFFTRFPLDPAPAPLNDRFEPNDGSAAATNLGRVVRRQLVKLAAPVGDEDWFRVSTAATGDLTVKANAEEGGLQLRVELWDETGSTLLASGADLPGGMGQRLDFRSASNRAYLVRVRPASGATGISRLYTLDVQSLTADLGTRVQGSREDDLAEGAEAFYRLAAGAAGAFEIKLTSGADVKGNLNVQVLDPVTLAVLATGQPTGGPGPGEVETATLTVQKGQVVLLRVAANSPGSGGFTLAFTNHDLFATPQTRTLLFPTGGGPSQSAVSDFDRDGNPDVVVTTTTSDTVSVLLGNGDGTFQAPRQFGVGAFTPTPAGVGNRFPNIGRAVGVADFNNDGNPDVVVTNFASADVSVLLGRGDGTFEPQRRFDAVAAPFALDVGDLNDDDVHDLVVLESAQGLSKVAVLLGRGDGTFERARIFDSPLANDTPVAPGVRIVRWDGDTIPDLAVTGGNDQKTYILLGNGDGTFRAGSDFISNGPGIATDDLDGDGNADLVTANKFNNSIVYALGNGDGTVRERREIIVGQSPVAVVIADVTGAAGGGSDGGLDLIVANSGVVQPSFAGPAEVVVLPGLVTGGGQFNGFGSPRRLALASSPLHVAVADLDGDGIPDVVATDRDGVLVIFGQAPAIAPNTTPETARDLGAVVHIVQPTLTIVPGREDAYYNLTVPTEAVLGAGDQVIDFSGLFEFTEGAGLQMEVRDADGNLLGAGERFRIRAAQGAVLTLHVFGVDEEGVRGSGAYTLDVNVLPQLVSVESHALLPGDGDSPGGPTASLVLTFQGDRLDPETAQDTANYRVTWLGPDGDVVLPVASAVYNPSSNRDVATGTTFPTAVRQTVTLLFDTPLPAGSYKVEVLSGVQTAPFNEDEADLLTPKEGFTGHPVVSLAGNAVVEGAAVAINDLVVAAGALGSFTDWKAGTPFLTQLHGDLSAILDRNLTGLGDDPAIPTTMQDQIRARFLPALGAEGARPTGVLVIWLDPVSLDVSDPEGSRVGYDLQTNQYTNTFDNAYAAVAGNVEVVVLPTQGGNYTLQVADVPQTARGGVVFLGAVTDFLLDLTAALRTGITTFSLTLPTGSP